MDQTTRLLSAALGAAALRQEALSHNLANLNTPGFKRLQVRFEDELRSATAPDAVRPRVVRDTLTSGRPDGNNVDLERESVLIAENQIHYAALTRQMSEHLNRIRLVIFEGRR